MSKASNIQMEATWLQALEAEFQQPYFQDIKAHLLKAKQEGKTIYPPGPLIFNAFNSTPFDQVKVVVLGQDPYHNPGEAMGLCFSVPQGVRVPPSLKNVYKEMHRDFGFAIPAHGDLSPWTKQGVFLMNAMLTVEHKQAGSHKNIGWQKFTDAVIKKLSDEKKGLVFMLWGNFAKGKRVLIDESKHAVLDAAHPSPLARNAFQGCGHFTKCNDILAQQGKTKIDWTL